jgi:hypothetical protein
MAALSLSFEDNGRAHNDLVLRLDGFERRGDSYYLALDQHVLPEEEDAEKVRLVLVRLLEQWRDEITSLKAGEVTYLPFAFYDEGTEWLQVLAVGDDAVELLPVWWGIEGWSLSPSSLSDSRERIARLSPNLREPPLQRMSRREMLDEIQASIVAATTER